MRFSVNDRIAESIFRIGGQDENALTAALSICISQSDRFLRTLLSELGIKNIHSKSLVHTEIRYQRHGSNHLEGITDIELLLEKRFHVIIEAKVGQAVPTIAQCVKYLPRFAHNVPENSKYLAVLLDSADTGIAGSYGKKEPSLRPYLRPLIWGRLHGIAQTISRRSTNPIEKFLLTQFCYFVGREYRMKSYEEEVWVVPVGTKPLWTDGLSFYDIPVKRHIYFHPAKRSRRRSIYFAPRAHGKVECVQKILRIDYDVAPKDYVPELSRFSWASQAHNVFHLTEPIALPSPVKSGKVRNTVFYVDFDLLLRAKTIKEAHQLKAARSRWSPLQLTAPSTSFDSFVKADAHATARTTS